MRYTATCPSPLGAITLASDGEALTGLWFEGQKYYARRLAPERQERDLPVFRQARKWLDLYFSGQNPDFTPPLRLIGSPFQARVWTVLTAIPYGQTRSYGEIAQELAAGQGLACMSAQAVGGAVGKNPISILVPCHRVVGKDGNLTGYAGGVDKKAALLKLEGAWRPEFFIPKHSTAP